MPQYVVRIVRPALPAINKVVAIRHSFADAYAAFVEATRVGPAAHVRSPPRPVFKIDEVSADGTTTLPDP